MPPSGSSFRTSDPTTWPAQVRSTLPRDHPAYLAPGQSDKANARNILAKLVGDETADRLLPTTGATDHRGEVQDAKPKRDEASTLERTATREKESVRRATVRFVGYRVRPLDPDNFAGSVKDLLDGLRHAGLIIGDEPWHIRLETEQEKVGTFAEEKTVIQIYPPTPLCTTPTQ